MHKALIQTNKLGFPVNSSVYNAYQGLDSLGYEINPVKRVLSKHKGPVIASGTIEFIDKLLGINEVKLSEFNQLTRYTPFLKRQVFKSTLEKAFSLAHEGNKFSVKPVGHKIFNGTVVLEEKDLLCLAGIPVETEVLISEYLDITSEFRVYISDSEILGTKSYRGSSIFSPSGSFIRDVMDYQDNMPRSYALDIGICRNSQEVLIEVTEAVYAGNYGLPSMLYAQFLETRYQELFNIS